MSFVFICLQYIMKRTLKVDKSIEIFTYIDQKISQTCKAKFMKRTCVRHVTHPSRPHI